MRGCFARPGTQADRCRSTPTPHRQPIQSLVIWDGLAVIGAILASCLQCWNTASSIVQNGLTRSVAALASAAIAVCTLNLIRVE